MLRRIYIDNFRCLVNFELRLAPLTLLTGLNGSGKSTVFEALSRVKQFIAGDAKAKDLFPVADLTQWQRKSNQTFTLEMDGYGGAFQYDLEIEHNLDKHLLRVGRERLLFDGKPLYEFLQGKAQLYHDNHERGPEVPFDWSISGLALLNPREDNKKRTWFKDRIQRFVIAYCNPFAMVGDTSSEANTLSRDMSNFISWYRYLSQEHQPQIIALAHELAEVLPGFQAFRFKTVGEDVRILQAAFPPPESNQSSLFFGLSELSDGQRALIALYTLVFALRDLDYSLFLDEPDNFLALPEIQPWAMTLSDACSGQGLAQAVVISHHPEMIDLLGTSHGVWFEREPYSPVRVKEGVDSGETGLPLSQVIARGWVK